MKTFPVEINFTDEMSAAGSRSYGPDEHADSDFDRLMFAVIRRDTFDARVAFIIVGFMAL